MIIVRFTSGLGNQMFQYNLYSTLRERFPDVEVKADLTWFSEYDEHQGFELLRIFKREDNPLFKFDVATAKDLFKCTGQFYSMKSGDAFIKEKKLLRYPNRVLRLFSFEKHGRRRIDQTGFEDNEEIFKQLENIDTSYNYYITGFFIEEVYYKNRLDKIRQQLCFDINSLSDKNKGYLSDIENSNSVSIHIRRGDYLSDTYKDSFKVLSMDYYKKAVSLALNKYENPKFFVFSDDKEFIKQNFSWIENKEIIEGNSGKESYRDLQLMSNCKMNIIANSTFSMWAGILNANADALVVYPEIYMAQKNSEEKTLDNWMRL